MASMVTGRSLSPRVTEVAGLRPAPNVAFSGRSVPSQPRCGIRTARHHGGTRDMRCYQQQHRFYAGVDLHARTMFTHVLDAKGKTVFEQDLPTDPDVFLDALAPFRPDLVVGAECMFSWYWLADLCQDQQIPFALGHALAMKHIHGGKTKTDKIDAAKLAALLRGGLFPMGYVYPRARRQTRDRLRRRSFFVRQPAQLIAHVVNTNTQFNLPPLSKKLTYAANRSADLADRFPDPSTKLAITTDLAFIDAHDRQIADLERYLVKRAKVDDPVTFG